MWNLNNKNTKKQAHINREQTVAVRGGWWEKQMKGVRATSLQL